MRVASSLWAYAALLVLSAPPLLRRSGWLVRAPGVGIAVWLALCASAASSLWLAGLVLAVPPAPGRPVATLAGLALIVAVAACGAGGLARAVARARRQARRHAEAVALLGRPAPELGAEAVVVDNASPGVWCVAGRPGRRRIVVTSAAVRALDDQQLRAVVAHERAHLRGRHYLLLLAADAMALAFPGLPLFRHARVEVAALMEMLADDYAARRHGRAIVATALLRVAGAAVPETALAAGGLAALRRMRRMLVPPRPLGLPAKAASLGGAGAMIAFPIIQACVPLGVLAYLAIRWL